MANEGDAATYMQCFFHENNFEPNETFNIRETQALNNIKAEIRQNNSFYRSAKQHMDQNRELPLFRLVISDTPPENAATRTYNQPTATEVSVIITGDDNNPQAPGKREVIIHSRGGTIKRISSIHSSYDPLSYTITHIHGDQGFTLNINKLKLLRQLWIPDGQKHVTPSEYYSYRLHTRDATDSPRITADTLLYGGMLFQQYLCDQYLKVEEQRINWQRFNQVQLKAASYSGLMDAVAANEENEVGQHIILSSSFTGSPRYLQQNYHDAMAVVRQAGKPDLFITMTANPNWREITENLHPGQKPHDRPDLITRVFYAKMKQKMQDIIKYGIFGRTVAHLQVIEFQKRGLPHAHILIILDPIHKPFTADEYDKIIIAEIPNPQTHPRLYAMVTSTMMHGPCGASNPNMACTDKLTLICDKDFPKSETIVTTVDEQSFPNYRRRCRHKHTKRNAAGQVILQQDDRDVVPYNAFLLYKYNCHINVAFAMTINKAQGQSLLWTGIWLPEPVFAHGQLYVALSRSGDPDKTKLLIYNVQGKQGYFEGHEGCYTANIVYREVLDSATTIN